jgi:hypothetical protein
LIPVRDHAFNERMVGEDQIQAKMMMQGGERVPDPQVYLKVLKLGTFPSHFFNDSTPHCLQSPKLIAPFTT